MSDIDADPAEATVGLIDAAVSWLCSDAGSLTVRHQLAVDGGWALA